MTTFKWKIYRRGNTERWYDRHVRCWYVRAVDAQGNQIGNCHTVYTVGEAKDVQDTLAATGRPGGGRCPYSDEELREGQRAADAAVMRAKYAERRMNRIDPEY